MKKAISILSVVAMLVSSQVCFAQTRLTHFDTVVFLANGSNDSETMLKNVVESAELQKNNVFYTKIDSNANHQDVIVTVIPKMTMKQIMKSKSLVNQ